MSVSKKPVSSEELLSWCREITSKYPLKQQLTDFSSCWSDGIVRKPFLKPKKVQSLNFLFLLFFL